MKTKDSSLCTLYLVRHGETEWNVNHIVQGQGDSPLTPLGVRQAEEKAAILKDIHFDAIFSSDLPRGIKTAEILKLDRDIIIETSNLLREMTYGRFEGKSSSAMKEELKDKLSARDKLSGDAYLSFSVDEEIETYEAVVQRFITKLREIAAAYQGKTVLVICHGGPLRMFLVKLGYAAPQNLPVGAISNGGHVTVVSDGLDFFIKDIQGITPIGGAE